MDCSHEEDRLSYLLSGSCEVLPSSYIKLRSYLNIHSSKVAEEHNFSIFKNRNSSCPYCFSSWSCDTSSFKLLPSKKLKRKFKKRAANVEPDQKEAAKELRNVLVLKCKVCTRKSSFSLTKKNKIKEKDPKEEENVKHVKKKKKKKDKACGLLVNVEKIAVPSPQPFALRKKTGSMSVKNDQTPEELTQNNSQKFKPKPLVKSPNLNSKLNPFAEPVKRLIANPILQNKFAKNKQQKLKELKKAVKGSNDIAKKTLKDFLTLI